MFIYCYHYELTKLFHLRPAFHWFLNLESQPNIDRNMKAFQFSLRDNTAVQFELYFP